MPVQLGDSHVAFASRGLDQFQRIDHQPNSILGQLNKAASRKDQLFVPNLAGNFVATGVTSTDLNNLRAVNLDRQGSARLGSLDTARKILTAAGLPPAQLAALPGNKLKELALLVAGNTPHANAWTNLLHSMASSPHSTPEGFAAFVKTTDFANAGAPPFADLNAAKLVLTNAGLPAAHVNGMAPDRALSLAKFVQAGSPAVGNVLTLEQAVVAGNLNPKVPERIIDIHGHSPQLAGKLIQMGLSELAGAPNHPPGLTHFTTDKAHRDVSLYDLRGYPRPAELPGQALLGFAPKMHCVLPQQQYDAMKARVTELHNAYGNLSKVHFDDAARRVDFGYSMEELAALERGRLPAPNHPHAVPPGRGPDNAFHFLMIKSPDFVRDAQALMARTGGVSLGAAPENIQHFGNPAYCSARQDARLDAIAGIYRTLKDHDYTHYDTTVTSQNAAMQLHASNHNNADFLQEVLQTRDYPGIAISESHDQRQGRDFIAGNMANLYANGVRVIGLEHLNVEGAQDAIDAYLDVGFHGPMPQELECMLRGLLPGDSILNIVLQAKAMQVGGPPVPKMEVVAINANNLRAPIHNDHDSMPMRDGMMNAMGKSALDTRLAQVGGGAKFCLLAGAAHNKSHAGFFDSGVPGFSQLYGVPTLQIQPKVGVGPDFPVTVVSDEPDQRKLSTPVPKTLNRQLLGELSGKTGAIHGNITHEGVQERLDERLFHSTPAEQQQIKELLHFGIGRRGNTTVATRLQIRTALAQGLAAGVPVADLTALKGVLMNTPPNKLGPLITDLNDPAKLLGATLSHHLLDIRAAGARETFAALRPLLTFGPPDPTKANQGVYGDASIALRRDAAGVLQIANVDVALVRMTVPPENQGLSPADLLQIKGIFQTIAATPYSHQAVLLDFAQHFREQRALHPGLTMKQAFDTFVPDGPRSMAKYGHGDCICQAEAMVEALNAIGIKAYVGGVNNTGLTKQKPFADLQPQGIGAKTCMVTHTEVLIPYTDQAGNERVFGFSTGGGPQDKWTHDNPLTTGGIVEGASRRLDPQGAARVGDPPEMRMRLSPDGGSIDTVAMQKDQFVFRTGVSMVNTAPTVTDPNLKEHFNLNLLDGTITLSTKYGQELADQNIRFANMTDAGNGQLSFSYRDALSNPGDPVTLHIGGVTHNITKLQSLALLLREIRTVSGGDDTFEQNLRTLMSHEGEFGSDILSPDLAQLQQVMPDRAGALAMKPATQPRLGQWEQLMGEARDHVNRREFDQAQAKWVQAIHV